MAAGNLNVHVSDHNLRTDLLAISDELRRPLLLLFDEGNILAKSRIHLEKLRNTFMNLPGYMLVITGTPDLFPVMDDVFSPIVRQFKKISIEAFRGITETEQCIRRPLERLGLSRDEVFDFSRGHGHDAREIHELSGGRPHEIQLICHILFRRVQTGRAAKMNLDLSALDELRRELETSSDIATRPVISRVKSLNQDQLNALSLLTAARAPFDQLWTAEYIVNGSDTFSEDDLRSHFDSLVSNDIIKQDEVGLVFAGDDFEKIYCRYLAKEKDASLSFSAFPIDLFWQSHLSNRLGKIKQLASMTSLWFSETEADLTSLATSLCSDASEEDIFVTQPGSARELYSRMLDYRTQSSLPLLQIRLSLPWLKATSTVYAEVPEALDALEAALEQMNAMALRAREKGAETIVERLELPIATIDTLARKVERSANQRAKSWIATQHVRDMVDSYLERADVIAARLYAELVIRYTNDLSSDSANNIGYVLLAAGEVARAKDMLERAIRVGQDANKTALPTYNLAVCFARLGDLHEAITLTTSVVDAVSSTPKEDRIFSCLFVAKLDNGVLIYDEHRDSPDLLDCAQKSLEAFQGLLL